MSVRVSGWDSVVNADSVLSPSAHAITRVHVCRPTTPTNHAKKLVFGLHRAGTVRDFGLRGPRSVAVSRQAEGGYGHSRIASLTWRRLDSGKGTSEGVSPRSF